MAEKTLNTIIVLKNDTKANWDLVADSATLRVGEIGIESDTGLFKIGASEGEGESFRLLTWGELKYANEIPEVDLSEVTNNVQVVDGTVDDLEAGSVVGDMAIVRSIINGNIKSHTAYVWNGSAWAAMDGNYNASNVYYDKNIQVTQSVGNVTTSNNAPVDLQFAGKNMEQIWQYLYATEDLDLSITQPSSSLSLSTTSVSQEIGTTFNDPTVTLSFSDGEYEYGSKDEAGVTYTKANKAGVVWNAADITGPNNASFASMGDTPSNSSISKIYDLSENAVVAKASSNVVTEGTTKYTFKSKSSCPASVRKPVTNLGNFIKADGTATTEYSDGTKQTDAITDQEKSATLTVTGWRGWFEGYKATGSELNVASLTSANVRGLGTAKNGSFSTSMTNVPVGTNQLMFACPTGKVNFTLKDDGVTVNTGFTVAQSTPPAPWTVKHATAEVAGADGNNAITYDVFYCNDVGTIDKQNLTIAYTKK